MQTSFDSFLQQCQYTAWRGLLHIAGEQSWTEHCLAELLNSHPELRPVSIQANVQRLQSQLGSETDCLFINAFQGFNPNMLGMAAATLTASGILILLTPEFGEWANFADADYSRMLGAIDAELELERRFLSRAEKIVAECGQYLRLQQNNQIVLRQLEDLENSGTSTKWQPRVEQEQQLAIEKIKKVATGRSNRPLVLTADRGRGKSAALGIACAKLMEEKPQHIAVTSVSPRSVERLFYHLAESLQLQAGETEYSFQQSSTRFYAIDELLQLKPECQLLIIDEAAAIPVHLLQQCVQHFKRIVFSTTVKGYEGNGRGFELRFLPYLQQQSPQLSRFELLNPLRWRSDDPLEKTLNRLLLLDLDEEASAKTNLSTTEQVEFVELQQQELVQNEALLRQFFALLVNAHYQTSPDDLRMLLDHPALKLFALQQNNQLVAAAVILQEGELSSQWQEKLQQGRRPSGHLLPQVLFNDGFSEALSHSYWRVVRIAVQPKLQRQKLGQNLLKRIEQHCTADFLAASFSLSSDVLPFWQSQGFSVCRLGSHKSSSTGQFSVVLAKAQNTVAKNQLQLIQEQYKTNLPLLFLSLNQTLDAQTTLLLLKGLNYPLSQQDQQQVQWFAEGKAGLEQVFAPLFRWLLHKAGQDGLDENSLVVVDKVLLNKNWQQLSSLYNLSGRKAIESQMRAVLLQLHSAQ